jgi:hypothetical protein
MRWSITLTATFAFLVAGSPARSASPEDIEFAVQVIKSLCIAGSTNEHISLNQQPDAAVSVGRAGATGEPFGPAVRLDRESIEGLVLGINNAVSGLAADQANRARDCMKPYLERILSAILPGAQPRPMQRGPSPEVQRGRAQSKPLPQAQRSRTGSPRTPPEHYFWGVEGCLHRTPHGVLLGLPQVKCQSRGS